MPSLIRLLVVVGLLSGFAYGAIFALATLVQPKPREITVTIPQDRLADLFLDMLAAERGAAANTLTAYRRDLDDFATYLASRRKTVATATSEDLRAYLATL